MDNFSRKHKYWQRDLFIGVNVLFMFCGLFIFSYAVASMTVLGDYKKEEQADVFQKNVAISTAGCLLMSLSVIGYLGTVTKNIRVLYMYIIIIMFLMVLHSAMAIVMGLQSYVFRYQAPEELGEDFYRNMTGDEEIKHAQMWDKLQTLYECCGLNSPVDYAAIGRSISVSCCRKAHLVQAEAAKKNMYQTCIESKSYYMVGCEDEILRVLKAGDKQLFQVAVLGVMFETLIIMLALMALYEIKDNDSMRGTHVHTRTYEYLVQ